MISSWKLGASELGVNVLASIVYNETYVGRFGRLQ